MNTLSTSAQASSKNKNLILESLRFLFTIGVIFGHTYCLFFQNNTELKDKVKEVCIHNASVDFFFILSGFLLALHFGSNFNSPVYTMENYIKYILSRIRRLFPLLLISSVYGIIENIIISKKIIFNKWPSLFFLGGLNNFDCWGLVWYISALFWATLIFSFILVNYREKAVYFIIPLIFFITISISKVLFSTNCLGTIPLFANIFSGGLIRAFYCIAGGILAFFTAEKLKENLNLFTQKAIILSSILIELLFTLCIAYILFKSTTFDPKIFFVYFVFPIFMIITYLNKNVIYKILNLKISNYLGKISSYIYISHFSILVIIANKTNIKSLPVSIIYFVCIVISIIFGILTYHLFNLFMKFLKKIALK